MKSSPVATLAVAWETDVATATSTASAPMSAANSARALSVSPIQASQSIPASFQDPRYASAAALVVSHCGACEQLFIGMCVARIGMRLLTSSRS